MDTLRWHDLIPTGAFLAVAPLNWRLAGSMGLVLVAAPEVGRWSQSSPVGRP